MQVFTDQVGRSIELYEVPSRIVSLVPSQTELLFTLGLEKEVVGITKFCVHPGHWFHNKIRVGGTKDVKISIVHQRSPDLIIANKEENVKEQVLALAGHYPVWISDVNNLQQAIEMIQQVGLVTDTAEQAIELADTILYNFNKLKEQQFKPATAIYLIWQNPYMGVGGDCFINNMMQHAGFKNLLAGEKRYPEITIEQIRQFAPEFLLLSSEPFPFNESHKRELEALLPSTRIVIVDGEMFSWYGSRLLKAPAYFAELREKIH